MFSRKMPGMDEYRDLLEIIEEQFDSEFQAGLDEAWKDYKEGNVCTIQDLLNDLREDINKVNSSTNTI